MQFRTAFHTLILGVFVSLVVAIGYAEVGSPEATIPREKLSAACRKAKADFRPLTQADVAQAKTALREAFDRLDEKLTRWGSVGDDWKKYLLWEKLDAELRGATPNVVTLDRIRRRYNADHDGLELAWFLDVQRALRNYMAVTKAVDNPQVRTEYEKQLNGLTTDLDSYLSKPTTKTAADIGSALRWLQDAHQQPELVEAIQRRLGFPNLYVKISADFVGIGLADTIDDVTPVSDSILGTEVQGTAHTQGTIHAVLQPNADAAVIDALFSGSAHSDNVGYHKPVTVWSEATTDLTATKRIWIQADGFGSHPAVSNAETSLTIQDIQSKHGCGLIERIGWKRAGQQQSEAECIASQHAEGRLNARIDAQADESLEKANQQYVEKFKRPFTDRKLFPQKLQFATTEQSLTVVAVQAGGGKVAASSLPPAPKAEGDITLQIHESAINNLAFDALAGRTVHEDKMQAAVTDLLGQLPEKMKGDEDGKPWAITFATQQPISVSFADGGFKITLRGAKYYKGGEAYPAMDITATYKIEKTAKGFNAVRQGDIEVFPPDVKPGSGKQVDAHRQVIRTLLQKRFAKVFEKEILGEGFELSGKWKAAGKLLATDVISRDGWLVIVWRRTAESKAVAAK